MQGTNFFVQKLFKTWVFLWTRENIQTVRLGGTTFHTFRS